MLGNFSNNQGLSSRQAKNAVDQKYTYVLGLNNGIIVGFGNLEDPADCLMTDSVLIVLMAPVHTAQNIR